MTAAAIGIPTLAHWLWSGRRHPIAISYHRVLLYIVKWFGTIYAALGVLFLVIASADLLFDRGLGSPVWAPLFGGAMIAIGLTIRWLAGVWLLR